MDEELITTSAVDFLEKGGWCILSYDFPQSGTGCILHPDEWQAKTKNLDSIIPDIIARKDKIGLISENKVDYYQPDIEKLKNIRAGHYSEDIAAVFGRDSIDKLILGLCLRKTPKNVEKIEHERRNIDFYITLDTNHLCELTWL